jgi:hypothetical protein
LAISLVWIERADGTRPVVQRYRDAAALETELQGTHAGLSFVGSPTRITEGDHRVGRLVARD